MNALTEQEKQACRKASEYYAAMAEGKEASAVCHNGTDSGYRKLAVDGELFFRGYKTRILAPPKMRPYRDEELPELLGVKKMELITKELLLKSFTPLLKIWWQ